MNALFPPKFISRIILTIVITAGAAAAFLAGAKFLESVSVPPPPPVKEYVKFNAQTDISKNPVFADLEQIGPNKVEPGESGRANPFIPIQTPKDEAETATTTESVLAVPSH